MTKRTHEIFFAAIILNLVLILILVNLTSLEIFFCSCSLLAMIVLPLGRKGGTYHKIVSTSGLILFLFIFLVEN